MEGLEAWDHLVDLFLAGEDRAPDVPCPGGHVASRDLLASRTFARRSMPKSGHHNLQCDMRSFPHSDFVLLMLESDLVG
jgi:hypothetical protein